MEEVWDLDDDEEEKSGEVYLLIICVLKFSK